MLTIRDLMKLELFKTVIKENTQNTGLDKTVTWPYIKQTSELKKWVNGGEIVFVLGDNENNSCESQMALLSEGKEASVSAFVFLCGDEGIKKVYNRVIAYGNSIDMPIFTMPYNVKLIDVIKEISNAIIDGESRDKMVFNFLNDLLNKHYSSENHIIKQGYECGVRLDGNCLALAISTDFNYDSENYDKIMTYRNTINYVLKRIEHTGSQLGIRTVTSFNMSKSLCLFFSVDKIDADCIKCEVDEFLDYFFRYNELAVFSGYSSVNKGVKGCLKSVDESKKAVSFAKKTGKLSCTYSDMGFLGLVISSHNKNELMDYCREVLGGLIDSDKNNGTEYMLTLKIYIESNNNLVACSNKLFIHRNTLINRLNHIEELTGKSLKNPDTRMEYLCVFRLLEYISD